ncbi:carboxypeptidase M32 [Evansella cellulosilytica]|uniref:Metal-dependent carboxypeptidase n=1 Tax=Evansella cellulosilytica (strain ATCC 21833 / DSM 2522 / FERM P-1141 / JCM 9156 / N-4) TaxID=649639 RepID=E6U295_EVAC2|nr:carboxypeptidase M32 [Evansella cellulosilytica]ADU30473.1 Carboxypeptidase Taq [Evansella cellulosilytica DSM 2522]
MSKDVEQQFRELIKKISNYNEAIGVLAWDLRTGAPKKGVDQRSEVLGTLSSEVFRLSTSQEMKQYIKELRAETVWGSLDDVTQGAVLECEKDLLKLEKIPEKEYSEYVILTAKAESIWAEAKDAADFTLFQPYLEKIVEFNRKYVEWVGYETNKYNTLLDDYEPGLTVDIIDDVFGQLKDEIVPLLKEVTSSSYQPKTDFLFEHFPKENQEKLSIDILKSMQYDFEAGRLDTTVHPFAIGLNPGDVRVTTKYDEKDFRTAVFGTIHEGGHALYEQNIDKKYVGTPLCTGTSMGIHESQSLFWENFVGRNKAFWEKHYDKLKSFSSGQFDRVTLEEFYDGINVAGPSFIRIEADEMTYSLHIILRYELEKALINGELEVKDLPKAWNDKMEELLGIRPSNDAEGVLQDVHWSGGSFGYFPSYALGYVYAAQLKSAMDKDIPHFEQLLSEGNLTPIKEWLTEKVHKHGKSKKPLQILKDVTSEGVNAKHLIQYLKTKYHSVYKL